MTGDAIVMMKELLVSRPADFPLINALAELYFNSGNYKEAISTWNIIMATDDKNARTMFKIGKAYIKMGKGREGRSFCDEAVIIDPSLATSGD